MYNFSPQCFFTLVLEKPQSQLDTVQDPKLSLEICAFRCLTSVPPSSVCTVLFSTRQARALHVSVGLRARVRASRLQRVSNRVSSSWLLTSRSAFMSLTTMHDLDIPVFSGLVGVLCRLHMNAAASTRSFELCLPDGILCQASRKKTTCPPFPRS